MKARIVGKGKVAFVVPATSLPNVAAAGPPRILVHVRSNDVPTPKAEQETIAIALPTGVEHTADMRTFLEKIHHNPNVRIVVETEE